MQPRTPFFSICSLFLFFSFLFTGCGEGGGASSGSAGLTYTGLTTTAQITASNAEELAISAFEGGSFMDAGGMTKGQSRQATGQDNRSSFAVSKALRRTVDVLNRESGAASSAKAASGAIPGDASCAEGPGSLEYSLSYPADYSAKAVFIYNGYCSMGTRLTGTANADFKYDAQTLQLLELLISFDTLTVQSGAAHTTASGTIRDYNFEATYYFEVVNMLIKDDVSSKVFKTQDLNAHYLLGSNYVDITIPDGVFYHPDYGFVGLGGFVLFYDDDNLPSAGRLQLSGANGSHILVWFYPSGMFKLAADVDGDNTYEIVSEVKPWGGR